MFFSLQPHTTTTISNHSPLHDFEGKDNKIMDFPLDQVIHLGLLKALSPECLNGF